MGPKKLLARLAVRAVAAIGLDRPARHAALGEFTMINVTDALLVARRDANGNVNLGLRITDDQSNSMWLNSRRGFDTYGAATLTGMGYEATVQRSNSESYDFAALLGDVELVGWRQSSAPHCVGFKPKQTDSRPIDLHELI
jgi:hypothetical protein